MAKPNFDVVLIARNEEKTLPRLLGSLGEFMERGGSIVIVDTGSTDKTVEVAKSLGAKVTEVGDRFVHVIDEETAKKVNEQFVVEGENPVLTAGDRLFDFAAARNFAASLATNDMIAMPDCDEVFTRFDLDAICKGIEEGVQQYEYNFVFAHDAQGLPTIAFMHSKFFDRRVLKWVGVVHEVLSGEAKRKFLDETICKLEHFQNHQTNRSGYLKGLALDCYSNPTNDRNSHYFGRELFWTNRPKSAIRELERHVAMNKWDAERSQSCIFIGDAYRRLGNDAQALAYYHKASDIYRGRREPLIRLAEYYASKGDHQGVVIHAMGALTIPQTGFYADNAEHYRQVPHELLYSAFWYLGDKEKSREHFGKAFTFLPKHPKYLHDQRFYDDLPKISILLPTLGREESLERAKKSIEHLIYPKELIELMIVDGPETVPNKIAEMYKRSTGNYIVFAANDCEFAPESLMLALNYAREEGKGLVAFNTGAVLPDRGNICEHFLIKRELIEHIGGEIFCTRMNHCGVDNLLWAKCEKLGQASRCEDAVLHHYHFSKGTSEWDWVYEKAYSLKEQDRAILAEELALLNA